MEGNIRQENIDRGSELTRSSSDTSSLTVANVKQDDSRAWTDEKHNLYLNHLEMSFVTRLNQSKELPGKCTDPGSCQEQLNDVYNDSDQFTVLRNGRWLRIKYQGGRPISTTSVSSSTPHKSTTMVGSKSMEAQCYPPSSNMPQLKKLCNTETHEKGTISHAISKRSPQFSSNSSYHDDSAFCSRECTGQNFGDDDNHNKASSGSPEKRFRTASAGNSTQDQIVPSESFPEQI